MGRLITLCLIITLLLTAAGCGRKPTSMPAGQPGGADPPIIELTNSEVELPATEEAQSGASPQVSEDTPAIPNPTPTPQPSPDELLTIDGRVVLPTDSGLALGELSLLTNLDTVALDSDGGFSAELARNPALPSLVILVNQAGNPVMLASKRGAQVAQPWEISVDSTARALVLFDPAVWALTGEQQDQVENAMPEHSYFQYLGEMLLSTIQGDPQDPLNGELHQDPYGIAALITSELVENLTSAQQSSLPGNFKGLFAPTFRPLAKSNDFVWVEDDIKHDQPEVTLVNNTFCFYTATIYAGPEGSQPAVWNNTETDPLVLDKSKLYSIRFMPTAESNMGTERKISPGDGSLRFVFKLDTKRTVWDLGWSLVEAIIGGLGTNVAQSDKMVYGLLKESSDSVFGDLMLLISAGKGKSSDELAGEVVGWFAKNALKVTMLYAEAMSAEWKEKANSEFFKKAAGVLGSKLLANVLAGYTGTEIITTAYSLANSPGELSEQGVQRAGRYPALRISAQPGVIRLPDLSNMHIFMPGSSGAAMTTALATEKLVVTVEDVPEDMTSFQIYINYQDGTPPQAMPVSAENGRASLEDIHTFIGVSPAVKIEVLDYLTSQPIAGISVPVLIGAAATNKIFTLRFEYDPGACTNWQCETGWSSCSRVNNNIPVRLIGEDKLVIAYEFENFEKHMSVYGSGSLNGAMINLSFTADFALDKTCPKGDTWEPCKLKETAEVTLSGPFDPTLDYEQSLIAGGASVVDWPLSEPPPSKDNSLHCTASVTKAFMYPGYTNFGR